MSNRNQSPSRRLARIQAFAWILLALLLVLGALAYKQAETVVLAAEGYIFGYPLVMMDLTRTTAAQALGPENQLRRARQFPDASFRGVVRPNVDTLYTTAFIDMAAGPWVFEMPAQTTRYEVMAFLDGWTNVFASPGTRTAGGQGGRYLLAGSGWSGEVPEGFTLLRSPTRMAWLVGRTQTNGVGDFSLVHGLQDGLTLRRLGAPPGIHSTPTPTPTPTPTAAASQPAAAQARSAIKQMQAMSARDFFMRLAALMVDNPPAAADGPMLRKLSRIAVAPGQPLAWGLLDRWSVALGRWIADFTVAKEMKTPRALVRGWSTPPAILGNYGTHYNIRAVVAMVGLGANLPEDASYPNTRVDAAGEPLNGSRRYRLRFKAGELPPVHAFWSVTAYGADDFLIANAIHRHALGGRDPLVRNPDGSVDLLIQAAAPEGMMQANWLPVKAGEPFLLNARLYWPKAEALDGRWGMPAVERLD